MDKQLHLAPGRILVENTEQKETKTDKGIILLRGSKTSLIQGKVIAVGPDLMERKMEVRPNDIIFFKKGAEMDVEYQKKNYWLLDWNNYLMLERE